jgi:hypothetical protein
VNKRLVITLVLVEIVLGVILYTHVLSQPEEATFPNHDKFDTGLDGWSYWGDSGYVLEWASNTANISGDGYGVDSGMQKVVDLSKWDSAREPLLLSFDWRATSDYNSPSGTTSATLWIQYADSGYSIYREDLVKEETADTGWRNYVKDISFHVHTPRRIRIILYLHDGWGPNWHQTNAYDNIRLSSTT